MAYQLVSSTPTISITQEALDQARAKQAELLTERVALQARLKDAREQGDLSENGAYKYAKFELASVGRQLRQLQTLLRDGRVKEKNADTTVAGFGHTVSISDGKATNTFMLVSHHESDPMAGKLSIESPIGTAIHGARVGQTVTAQTPQGERNFTVLSIT